MTKAGVSLLVFAQLAVTLALLGFAFYAKVDGSTRDLIVGAVIGHWLNQSNYLGREIAKTASADNTSAPAASVGG